jgi:hypothetical protein
MIKLEMYVLLVQQELQHVPVQVLLQNVVQGTIKHKDLVLYVILRPQHQQYHVVSLCLQQYVLLNSMHLEEIV